MDHDPARALRDALSLLEGAGDIVEERVDDAPPAWSERRGWTDFLLDLSDDELHLCEAEGLAAAIARLPSAPPSLRELAAEAEARSRLPALRAGDRAAGPLELAAGPDPLRAVRGRKRPQLAALLSAIDSMAAAARRIVDVGSGSGHLTRLAAELFERDAVGLERSAARVAAASARAEERAPWIRARGGAARFLEVDAGRDALVLEPTDLAVGLHACGALGDRLVEAARAAGCDVALVSCCLQKIDGAARGALSAAAAGLSVRREALGLTNLTSQPRGVETTIEATMEARQARHALLLLLRGRGLTVAAGEEMRGINRRRARGGLAALAERALALRGLGPPSDAEVRSCEERARRRFGEVRRLSLPRNMLARLIEVTVALDRAAALTEGGQHARVALAFDRGVSPRNVAVFASRDPGRLPLA